MPIYTIEFSIITLTTVYCIKKSSEACPRRSVQKNKGDFNYLIYCFIHIDAIFSKFWPECDNVYYTW